MHHGAASLSPAQQYRSIYGSGNNASSSNNNSSGYTGHSSVHSHHHHHQTATTSSSSHQYPSHYREPSATPAQSHFSSKFSEKRVYNESSVDTIHHGYHRAQHTSHNYPPNTHSYMTHPSSSSYHSVTTATPGATVARQQHESPIMTQHRLHTLPNGNGGTSTNGHLTTSSRYTPHDYANSTASRSDPRVSY
jgi:hypothetical protein